MSKNKVKAAFRGNFLLQSTLRVWKWTRRWEGHCNKHSPLTPLFMNPDFPPGLEPGPFLAWVKKGISVIGDLLINGEIMTFDKFKEKCNFPNFHIFRYLQTKSLISNILRANSLGICISPLEESLHDKQGST